MIAISSIATMWGFYFLNFKKKLCDFPDFRKARSIFNIRGGNSGHKIILYKTTNLYEPFRRAIMPLMAL